jgi:tRNA modification GTPase
VLADPQDTIVALSSAAGPGARAVVRLSGSNALPLALRFFQAADVPIERTRRSHCSGRILLPRAPHLPAELLHWPAPRSYTGQDIVELHTLGSPPLVELLIAELLGAGARAAQPGEFTLRAFLAGKLDLPRAEAVLGVIEAGSRDELRQALGQLAGGVTRPLAGLREDLLNLLADLEAGLDFADEDIAFVGKADTLRRLQHGIDQLGQLSRQLQERAVSDRPFRVALAGKPNVGKSSLFNALTCGQALVSAMPGTTRDYLIGRAQIEGVTIELIDTAGWQVANESIEGQAQRLGREQTERAELVLVCVESGREPDSAEAAWLQDPRTLLIRTKYDLSPTADAGISVVTGHGLDDLRGLLAQRARAERTALAPSLSRCRHHVEAALQQLRQAEELVGRDEPMELAALELRGVLDQLGEMVGAVYTDDLLDRIFSRFCIGK